MAEFDNVRPPAVAGQFYPGRSEALKQSLRRNVPPTLPTRAGRIRALVVPHAGYEYSGRTAGKAYALLGAADAVRRVLVIAPSHRVPFRGISLGPYVSFETPLGPIPVDVAACKALMRAHPSIVARADAHELEHALEVQLPFLQHVLPGFTLVPAVCGHLDQAELNSVARALADRLWNPGTLWIISSDFTHYGSAFGYVPFRDDVPRRLEELDRAAIDRILGRDQAGFHDYLERTGATVCGALPVELLLATLAHVDAAVHVELVEYTNSGRLTHDYSHTVSYASIAVIEPDASHGEGSAAHGDTRCAALSERDRTQLLDLARHAIRSRLDGHEPAVPDAGELSAAVRTPLACFITLTINGRLRGCIGNLEATEPLYLSVMRNARNSAFHDPRFPPLTQQECSEITIEITVLSPPRPIPAADDFEVGRHGIILEKGNASAVFLPQVALEQGWDRETTLEHLSLKAGLRPGDWRRGAAFKVFEAIHFTEPNAQPQNKRTL